MKTIIRTEQEKILIYNSIKKIFRVELNEEELDLSYKDISLICFNKLGIKSKNSKKEIFKSVEHYNPILEDKKFREQALNSIYLIDKLKCLKPKTVEEIKKGYFDKVEKRINTNLQDIANKPYNPSDVYPESTLNIDFFNRNSLNSGYYYLYGINKLVPISGFSAYCEKSVKEKTKKKNKFELWILSSLLNPLKSNGWMEILDRSLVCRLVKELENLDEKLTIIISKDNRILYKFEKRGLK